MAYLYYDEYDFSQIKTAKQLAQFILDITDRDEVPYGEMLDMIDKVCRYVKKNKKITKEE